ncbi:MAG: hypothetical protein CL910_06055 [Deltaproteobacteria bacterium]|jgi:DNA-binding GntR family transcriptional regulator|nr:hypothetical protein [Deltaproteobacteria bacterium]
MSRRELSDLYEFRARLEAFACELAAERAVASQLDELEQVAEAFEGATRLRDDSERIDRVQTTNEAFHQAMADATGNDFLSLVLATTRENPVALSSFRGFSRDELARSALFHRMIVSAVAERRGDRAGRLMTEHILQARDALVESYPMEDAS